MQPPRPSGDLSILLFHRSLQHAQGDGTERQESVVERAKVEFFAQPLFGLRSDLANLEFANLVGEGLAGPGDVSIDLALDLEPGNGRVCLEVGDGLVAGPALVV